LHFIDLGKWEKWNGKWEGIWERIFNNIWIFKTGFFPKAAGNEIQASKNSKNLTHICFLLLVVEPSVH
jgi:hypothetical protein